MSTVLSIIAALVILSIFVVIHELGHYGAGRLLGFKIVEFAVGMGPRLLSREKNGTIYSLRAFPIGGMCQFYGEDKPIVDAKSFASHKVWKRMLVILAGPVMNILAAIFFAVILLTAYGEFVPQIVALSDENAPAAQAGLLPGDIIRGVDGKSVDFYGQVTDYIKAANSEKTVITVVRGGDKIDITVYNIFNAEANRNMLGVQLDYIRSSFTFFEAVVGSVKYVWYIVQQMLSFLVGIFSHGVKSGEVAGPVGTISIIGQAVRLGLEPVLTLVVLISVNLGIVNLLPIPALDGGRLVFLTIEGIRRKPIPPDKEGIVHFIGFVLLIGLIILLTVIDISNLFG